MDVLDRLAEELRFEFLVIAALHCEAELLLAASSR